LSTGAGGQNLKALTRHFLASPEQFAWLLNFQRGQWRFITDTHKASKRGKSERLKSGRQAVLAPTSSKSW
jgi:hypothetical protein